MRGEGCKTWSRSESICRILRPLAEVALQTNCLIKGWIASECAGLDPKDCELCLYKVKPDESLVEACSDTDVQIVRQIWA